MVSTEEKRILIEQIIGIEDPMVISEDLKQQFYELFMRDTNGGKLYKYRTFDEKGYSLKNLKDGTLHCSKPSVFNDPFDCKIGITFQGMLEALYGSEMENVVTILERFGAVIQDSEELKKCNINEQRIFEKFFADENIIRFIRNIMCDEKTKEEKGELLKENISTIMKMIQTLCLDEAFNNKLGKGADGIESIIKNITSDGLLVLAEPNATLEDYAKANGINGDMDEIGYMMSLGKNLFPEYIESVNELQEAYDQVCSELSKKIDELLLVGCLSTNVKNRLMWSHYAKSHEGFCIEYDFSENVLENFKSLPVPVIYDNDRPQMLWEVVVDNNEENMKKAKGQIVLSLLQKDSEWKYENEWRIFVNAKESSEQKMPKMSCIYLGASISEENRTKILEIAKELKIPVKQMKVDRCVYDLHAEDVFV